MANELTTIPSKEPSIEMMMQVALDKGATPETLERLFDLYERMRVKDAEQQYNAAFVALQSEIPEIVAQSVIPNRGKYERFEDVMHVVGPLLRKNGFAVAFAQAADDKRITVTCTLRHIGGHSVATPFAVRIGGKADSDTQADCKASTTAKRNSLLQALNIVIRQDYLQNEDPHNEGGFITTKEAIELEEWVEATASDKAKFLAFAGAKTFAEIHASRLESLHSLLRAKEKK